MDSNGGEERLSTASCKADRRSGVAISTLHQAPTCGVHLCLHHRHSIIRPWLSFCLLALVAEPPLLRSSTPSHHIFQQISTIHGFLSLSSVSPISVQFMKQERLQIAQNNGNLTATCANSAIPDAPRVSDNNNKKQQQQSPLRCPRCDSANTKFCYFNNYSLSQPRHFCKACKRYWTRGGSLRNVPVGGGCRKNKRAVRKLPPPPRSHLLQPPPAQPRLEDAASALYAMSAFTSSSSSSLPISILSADLLLHLKLAEAQPFPAAGSDAVRVTDDYTNPLFGCSSSLPTCDQDYDELAALQLSFGELEAIKMMKEINWQEYQINNNYYKNDNSSDCNIAWQMSQSENSLDHNLDLNLLNANAGRLPESYSTNLNNFGSIAPPI